MTAERVPFDGLVRPALGTTDDAKDAKIDVVWGEGMQVLIRVTCPECGRVVEITARTAKPGEEVKCPCGDFTVVLSDDQLRDLQGSLDSLRGAFEDLGK